MRLAIRSLRRRPVFSIAAILAMIAPGFARVLKSFVYQLSPDDPRSLAWPSARRAAGVDPATALRCE